MHAIVAELDPHLRTLAHDGPVALRDRYELVYRRQAERPNMIWQADHTELDLLILDANCTPARPWLTIVEDDCSRAVAGYTVFLGAPSSLNLSLALRQAIWRKTDPGWAVHGIPDVLYADHGSDFTSDHLAQVAADLHIELVHSTVGRPTRSTTSTCCWSWSPHRGSCTATASASRACATSTQPWPPTSGSR